MHKIEVDSAAIRALKIFYSHVLPGYLKDMKLYDQSQVRWLDVIT